MDSHNFSQPIPADNDGEGNSFEYPTWRVDVHRTGVKERVGRLYVNLQNLPPRKGKKGKILWKLPDSTEHFTPQFGLHEQRRLYELFKAQKKERRKKLKEQQPKDNNEEGSSGEDDIAPYRNPNRDNRNDLASNGTASPTNLSLDNDLSQQPPPGLSTPPPPPGFGIQQLSLHGSDNGSSRRANCNGKSSGAAAAQTTTPLPPPPPGLFPETAHSVSPSTSLPFAMPPPMYFVVRASALTPTVPSEVIDGSNCAKQQLHHIVASALAAQVANVFCQLIPTGQIRNWLSYYEQQEEVPSALLMGTALASCPSIEDKLKQWQSLAISSPPPQWECQGWTGQRVSSTDDNNDHNVFVVSLTGQRRQPPQQCLAFFLTVILRRRYPERRPQQDMTETEEGEMSYYQICNEILGLTLLTG